MKANPTASVVIPVFNEQENLPELLERCLKACRSLDAPFEIILVDDGSRDRSPDLLREAAEKNPGEIIAVLLNCLPDQIGNMHILSNESAPDAKDLPKGFDPKAIKSDSELWVVAGKSYLPNNEDANWMNTPLDSSYLKTLSQELQDRVFERLRDTVAP